MEHVLAVQPVVGAALLVTVGRAGGVVEVEQDVVGRDSRSR
jgi:hypothetical protein